MSKDLTELTMSELKKLSKSVSKEIESRSSQSKKNLMKQIKKLCAEEGMELADLFDTEDPQPKKEKKAAKPKQAKKSLEPVYFNQANPEKNWSGRGRKPEWVATWIENGGNLEDLKKRPW